ncbi:hypothetical protein OGAPHI_003638 [Ogataea philodendri]|uniref:Uncharacterized protein n=1 Tax=Ogataea philodendri TaxID=1378263 RepID=A0A9P8P5P1_9ASCO|nr:uncharacterized protein OGAPHI_003638 [Ogataea philodendri]KAH3665454.1 hypothetical protein OGAPHI_003638 [Ogataea philodendri]
MTEVVSFISAPLNSFKITMIPEAAYASFAWFTTRLSGSRLSHTSALDARFWKNGNADTASEATGRQSEWTRLS